jgi:hypothetical protein
MKKVCKYWQGVTSNRRSQIDFERALVYYYLCVIVINFVLINRRKLWNIYH